MIFLAFLIIAGIIFSLSLKSALPTIKEKIEKSGTIDTWAETSNFWRCFYIPIILILFAVFNPFKLERVDAGHVGVKVNLTGDNRGVAKFQYKTGWVIFNSWISKLYEFPTYQQHIDYPEQQIITKGGFSATIKPSFNYAIKPTEVGDMFQSLRLSVKEIEGQWLQTAIVGAVNDVANKWSVDDVFNNRERFENDIVVEANKRVSKWFIISQLRTNITPPAALQKSIQEKTQAIQEVQVAENQKLVAQAEAQRKIAVAKGDSTQLVINAAAEAEANKIRAAGEADAIRLKQTQLTPEYIEYFKITKWNGALPQVQSGNAGILMNLNKQ